VSTPTFDWDPAGPDRALAVARGDVAALRIGAAREALAETRIARDYDARAFRSLVLAATAATSDVVETWTREDPANPDALLLYARVAAHRAVTAKRDRDTLEAINRISVWWLLGGVLIIAATLAFVPSHHQPPNYAGAFVNNTGFSNGLYGGLLGLLVTSWTYTGFDGSFHMSEETQGAATSAPRGITQSIRFSAVFGLVLMLALVYASQDWKTESAASVPPAQVLIDAVGLGTAKFLMLFPVVALLFCGLANMTSNSRQIWAFSRDGAIPGSRLWHRLSPRTRTPVPAVWLAAGSALVLTIPGWWNGTAFTAIVSVNVVGLFTAYGIPILLRLRLGTEFRPGPWTLGAKGRPIALLAVVWIVLSNILFMLPQSSPITHDDFNYAPVALAVVLLIATVWWFVSARRTFQGPRSTITPQDAVIDPDLM
jgi:amino acid transporter